MQSTTIAADPGRGIHCIDGHRFSIDRQWLMRHSITAASLAVDPGEAPPAGDDATVVRETRCGARVALLDGQPGLPFELESSLQVLLQVWLRQELLRFDIFSRVDKPRGGDAVAKKSAMVTMI